MNKPPNSAELQRRNYDPTRLYPRPPLTPEQIKAEIKRLEAENAQLAASMGLPRSPLKALPTRIELAQTPAQTLADREKRAKASAEALMVQMGLRHV
jgi:hypothetical protein